MSFVRSLLHTCVNENDDYDVSYDEYVLRAFGTNKQHGPGLSGAKIIPGPTVHLEKKCPIVNVNTKLRWVVSEDRINPLDRPFRGYHINLHLLVLFSLSTPTPGIQANGNNGTGPC